jgi:hypothetical protein
MLKVGLIRRRESAHLGVGLRLGGTQKTNMKTIALTVVLAASVVGGRVLAAPSQLVITLYADRAVPYLDPQNGAAHPFMCLTPADESAAKPECFGFYPRGESITSIQLSDGGALSRSASGWTETPGSYRFTQAPASADNVVLRDASRDITWRLSIPRGGSLIGSAGKASPWYQVVGVTFEPAPKGFIGSDWPESPFQELPKPWPTAALKFTKVINAKRRIDLLTIINAWNLRAAPLTQANMVDFLDASVATVGAKRPPRVPGQTPAAYVEALIRANP